MVLRLENVIDSKVEEGICFAENTDDVYLSARGERDSLQ